eukprot:16427014-Heterocapsa_arctica.AAC.1
MRNFRKGRVNRHARGQLVRFQGDANTGRPLTQRTGPWCGVRGEFETPTLAPLANCSNSLRCPLRLMHRVPL